MADEDVEDLLESAGWGVLSLAADGDPYSIPVSFGYDDDAVYFALLRGDPPNTKFDFIQDGASARLLVTNIRAKFAWRSVAVTGSVRAVTRRQDLGGEGLLSEVDEQPDRKTERGHGWDVLLETLEENAWFSSEYERADPVSELQGWRLEPDRIQGVEVDPDAR